MSVFLTEDISKYFNGNFYFHLNQGYYIFEELGYNGLKDNIDLSSYPFLKNLEIKLTIKNIDTNEEQTLNFPLNNLNKNYLSFDIKYSFIENFKISLDLFLKNKNNENNENNENKNTSRKILSKNFDINSIIDKYNNLYNDNFNTKDSRLIFLIEDFISKEINLKNTFCFNCTNEDLNNIFQRYNIQNFYVIHKMQRLLNFKYLDYKIYSSFLSEKKFKDKDLIVYKAKINFTKKYNIDYNLINFKEKSTVSQFFYLIKKFLKNVNFNGQVSNILNINSNKRRLVLYIYQLPKLNSKNYFNFIFQQNIDEIS